MFVTFSVIILAYSPLFRLQGQPISRCYWIARRLLGLTGALFYPRRQYPATGLIYLRPSNEASIGFLRNTGRAEFP